jgi:hypothetical protein
MDELTRGEISKLSRDYLEIRNAGQRAKAQREEMLLAERRGELIEKTLVEQQGAYIFVSLRQRILNLGQTWARRFVGLPDVQEAKRLIDEMARSTLTELAVARSAGGLSAPAGRRRGRFPGRPLQAPFVTVVPGVDVKPPLRPWASQWLACAQESPVARPAGATKVEKFPRGRSSFFIGSGDYNNSIFRGFTA